MRDEYEYVSDEGELKIDEFPIRRKKTSARRDQSRESPPPCPPCPVSRMMTGRDILDGDGFIIHIMWAFFFVILSFLRPQRTPSAIKEVQVPAFEQGRYQVLSFINHVDTKAVLALLANCSINKEMLPFSFILLLRGHNQTSFSTS